MSSAGGAECKHKFRLWFFGRRSAEVAIWWHMKVRHLTIFFNVAFLLVAVVLKAKCVGFSGI